MSDTAWQATKKFSTAAYTKALKPGLERVYQTVENFDNQFLSTPSSARSEQSQSTSLSKDLTAAAYIIRDFWQDGVQVQQTRHSSSGASMDTAQSYTSPRSECPAQKIDPKIIDGAKALAVFTLHRPSDELETQGSGILLGRNETAGGWTSPSGFAVRTADLHFPPGVEAFEIVLVINACETLDAFTAIRCTLGSDVGVEIGPLNLDSFESPDKDIRADVVWSYAKTRDVYTTIRLDGMVFLERSEENQAFYGHPISASDILAGKVDRSLRDHNILLAEMLEAGQALDSVNGTQQFPHGRTRGPRISTDGHHFGVPAVEDPDPYGVKALQAQGLEIREAGSQSKPQPETFNFSPAATSPVYSSLRMSMESPLGASSWRKSTHSVTSVDRATQTSGEDPELASPSRRKQECYTPTMLRQVSAESLYSFSKSDQSDQKTKQAAKAKVDERSAAVQSSEDMQTQQQSIINLDKENRSDKREADEAETKEEEVTERMDSANIDDLPTLLHETPQIRTAIPVVAKPRVVTVSAKRGAPSVPPRNPSRVAAASRPRNDDERFSDVSLDGLDKSDNDAPPSSASGAEVVKDVQANGTAQTG